MTTTYPQQTKRILIVEDEPNYRALVLTILRKAGFHCTLCVDGDHAINKLGQEKFDLMIVDYLLPGPNAIDIVQWARAQEIETPALIITNYPSDQLNVSGKALRKTKILAKPSFDPANMPHIAQEMLAA